MGQIDEARADQTTGEMTEHRETYVIIQRDGSTLCDFDGPEIQFESRAEAGRWLMPGESCQSFTSRTNRS